MIFAILVLVIIIVGYYISSWMCQKKDKERDRYNSYRNFFYDGNDIQTYLIPVIAICCCIIFLGGIQYLFGMNNMAKMEAFYDNTLAVYEYTVDKSENITIYAIKDIEEEMTTLFNAGNLAYFELAKSVNANLVELRDEVKEYNYGLYVYTKYNDFWLTDSFVPNVTKRLKPIKIK